jgi:hypothetical protein
MQPKFTRYVLAWMVGVCNGISRLAVSHIVQRCNPWNTSRIGVGNLVYSLRTTIVLWVSLVFFASSSANYTSLLWSRRTLAERRGTRPCMRTLKYRNF